MATIKCIIQSKNDNANIYLRLSIDRNNVFKRKTNYIINPKDWNDTKGQPFLRDEALKKLKTDLDNLCTKIEENYNNSISQGIEINGIWLQEQIDEILNKKEKTDRDRLTNYFQYYIDCLPNKVISKGKRGVSHATEKKYKTILNKIKAFEKYKKKEYYIKDVDMQFRNDLIKYFNEVEKLAANSTGRYIKFVKTVCNQAHLDGIEVNKQLSQIKGYTEKVDKIFLSFDELAKIEEAAFTRGALENAKDWLIIGCYIGQRVSDLLILTKQNINIRNGLELIELTQQKTGKKVAIPIHPKVKEILNKRNSEFPTALSAQKFNDHLKDIAKLAGITQKVQGGLMDKETKRKIYGTFEKWKLVSSHICRRSFASNFYGEIPTALLINITAHSTEKQFLDYIGKTPTDYAIQLADYWSKEAIKAKKKPVLRVVKKAN